MAATSAAQIAPETVITPARAQAASSQPGLPTYRADSADVMKIPEPIIDPITIMVASIVPSSRTSDASPEAGLVPGTSVAVGWFMNREPEIGLSSTRG